MHLLFTFFQYIMKLCNFNSFYVGKQYRITNQRQKRIQCQADLLAYKNKLENVITNTEIELTQQQRNMKTSNNLITLSCNTDNQNNIQINSVDPEIQNSQVQLQHQTFKKIKLKIPSFNQNQSTEQSISVSKSPNSGVDLLYQYQQQKNYLSINNNIEQNMSFSQYNNIFSQIQSKRSQQIEKINILKPVQNKDQMQQQQRLYKNLQHKGSLLQTPQSKNQFNFEHFTANIQTQQEIKYNDTDNENQNEEDNQQSPNNEKNNRKRNKSLQLFSVSPTDSELNLNRKDTIIQNFTGQNNELSPKKINYPNQIINQQSSLKTKINQLAIQKINQQYPKLQEDNELTKQLQYQQQKQQKKEIIYLTPKNEYKPNKKQVQKKKNILKKKFQFLFNINKQQLQQSAEDAQIQQQQIQENKQQDINNNIKQNNLTDRSQYNNNYQPQQNFDSYVVQSRHKSVQQQQSLMNKNHEKKIKEMQKKRKFRKINRSSQNKFEFNSENSQSQEN
ncbi:hypothetical protein PPERSA_11011 [Pseudocohnilembus persalinus]|uniref:Uncharacterized protein n=1 Tax=Pseudocohnilembus persalinus TaxID=266149 RepID=A0A0V0QYY1_PSEPJ|nr:hypothetical protein PPERSA_11011 [Pseudocohnilembus persalinus]|eukprot:KRX07462.1 hypothetical protein PPERSA_11011 [Pseudocohnilembus persalinus]